MRKIINQITNKKAITQIRLLELKKLFLFFLLTSFLGWFYEVFLEVVIYRWGYSDRGVLIGPYCPVYGVGAIVLLLCLYKLMHTRISLGHRSITPLLVFVGIVLITTIIELGASYVMEWTTGGWMWDYTRFTPNFQGRIAWNPSLRFGIGGMFFLYILYPCFQNVTAKISDKRLTGITLLLGCLFLADCIYYFL